MTDETARPPGMPPQVEPRVPDGAVAYDWTCAACGRWAMRVMAVPKTYRTSDVARLPLGVGVVAETGIGSIWTAASELRPDGSTVDIAALVRAGDAVSLRRLDPELAPLWCRGCGTVYCINDWRHIPIFDQGFFDEERGTCPAGHEQKLWD